MKKKDFYILYRLKLCKEISRLGKRSSGLPQKLTSAWYPGSHWVHFTNSTEWRWHHCLVNFSVLIFVESLPFLIFGNCLQSNMTNNILKQKIYQNLWVFGFHCKSLSLEPWQLFLWFLVMAAIQDGHHHVLAEDWPKLSGAQFLLQVFIFNSRAIAPNFMISSNNWYQQHIWSKMGTKDPFHPKWNFEFFWVFQIFWSLFISDVVWIIFFNSHDKHSQKFWPETDI